MMKATFMALVVLATGATTGLAQAPETTQGAMCASAPVMPSPTGTAEDRMLSDDAEVADRVVKSKASIEAGQAMAPGQVVLRAGLRHHAAVEYRRSPTPASLHTRMAELFYVVDGSADLILGGELTHPRCLNSSNLAGDGIEGGVTHRVKTGTYILVPENTAHFFTNIDETRGLTVLNLHVPSPAADQH
jgi:oxalate decarboxylase/phosphoglucose isomerase-like protein (cupin superfamily)